MASRNSRPKSGPDIPQLQNRIEPNSPSPSTIRPAIQEIAYPQSPLEHPNKPAILNQEKHGVLKVIKLRVQVAEHFCSQVQEPESPDPALVQGHGQQQPDQQVGRR